MTKQRLLIYTLAVILLSGCTSKADGQVERLKTITIESTVLNKPMLIAAVGIDNSFGLNNGTETKESRTSSGIKLNEGRYNDYFMNEVIPYIDSNYMDRYLLFYSGREK